MRVIEKDRVYDEYKNSVGDIVSGIVRRREKGIDQNENQLEEQLSPNRVR